MTEHKFMIPPPKFPTFGRWLWEVFTFSLIRKEDRRTFFRIMLYLGLIGTTFWGVLTATSSAVSYGSVLAGMVCMAFYCLWVALMLDGIERRQLVHRWARAEREAWETEHLKRVQAAADEFRIAAIEEVNKHARAVHTRLEQERRKDGEGWKS